MGERSKYFIAALRALVNELPRNERKAYKEKIAAEAGTKLSYLNDLAMSRRVGNEDLRCAISKVLDFPEYEDMIRYGKLISDPKLTPVDVKSIFTQQQNLRIKPDGIIEEITKDWPQKNREEKKEMRQLQRWQIFKRTHEHAKFIKTDENSQNRFQCLWESASVDCQTLLDFEAMDYLKQFQEAKITDIDVLEFADKFFKGLISSHSN